MELKSAPELQPYILKNVQRTKRILGCGSSGTVEELTFNHAPCAGKKMHKVLIDPHICSSALIQKFEQECQLMKELHHPHIVQFMGLCFFDDSDLPIIVMELLDSNVD